MKKGGTGGANTNNTGLKAESKILNKIKSDITCIEATMIDEFFPNKAIVGTKADVFKYEKLGLVFNKILLDSLKYKPQPDVFIFFPTTKVLVIIEIKNQDTTGTGWEKFEFGCFGYKNDVYQRVFSNIHVVVEGLHCGEHWNQIRYLNDVKNYIKREYNKKFYSENELTELIREIKKIGIK